MEPTSWIDISEWNRRYRASTIQALIESIYETESKEQPSQARTILRYRIFSTSTPSMSEIELVKSAAKRISTVDVFSPSPYEEASLSPPRPLPDFASVEINERVDPQNRIQICRILNALRNSDRPVSAFLADREGKVLALAWNSNAVIRNRHAEWNLCEVLKNRGGKIPAGAVLYTSLKPCRMCAARIWETAEDPASLRVLFLEDDPGPLARGTILEAGSPARVHYLGKRSPLFLAETQAAL